MALERLLTELSQVALVESSQVALVVAHGVGRVVGALGSEAGFAGSMLNWVISMMHVPHYHKNRKLQLSGLKKKKALVDRWTPSPKRTQHLVRFFVAEKTQRIIADSSTVFQVLYLCNTTV